MTGRVIPNHVAGPVEKRLMPQAAVEFTDDSETDVLDVAVPPSSAGPNAALTCPGGQTVRTLYPSHVLNLEE